MNKALLDHAVALAIQANQATQPAVVAETPIYADEAFYDSFSKEPIGGNNPYSRCSECKVSVPEINYKRSGHETWCSHYAPAPGGVNHDA